MADKVKVSQETINEIQRLGMKGSLAKWTKGGNTPEFDEAVRRYYGKGHRKSASSGGTAAESGPAPTMARDFGSPSPAATGGTRSTLAPETAKAAATRRVAGSTSVPSPGRKVSEMTLEERVASGRKALDAKPGLRKGKSLVGNPLHGIVHGIGNIAKWGTEQRRSGAKRIAEQKANRDKPTGRDSSLSEKQNAALRRLR